MRNSCYIKEISGPNDFESLITPLIDKDASECILDNEENDDVLTLSDVEFRRWDSIKDELLIKNFSVNASCKVAIEGIWGRI